MARKSTKSSKAASKNAGKTAAKATRPAAATRASVRMYRQGLGDCLFVTMPRAGAEPFRIMIDCGLVLGAPDATNKMKLVMADIVRTLDQKPLDLLVVTHPHWDHVSGFIQAPDDFAKIKADAVWLAWTEDGSDPLARKLSSIHAGAETHLRMAADRLTALGMQDEAGKTEALLGFLGVAPGAGRTTRDAVNIAAAKAEKPHYCLPGEPPFAIPGTNARIFVLGPPRDEAELRKMDPSSRAPETYSLTALNGLFGLGDALAGGTDGQPFTDNAAIPWNEAMDLPFFREHYSATESNWRKIDGDWLGDTTNFALLLDRAVNNSSLALAIELEPGGDVLLFAADAQVGNWLSWLNLVWTVDGRQVTGPDLIARTAVYKVGHHASLNASLSDQGVEKMDQLSYALVPVDAQSAIDRRWGNNIPFPDLLGALKRKAKGGVLRSDQEWTGNDPNVVATPLAHEVRL